MSDFGLAREANFNLEGGKFPIKWTAPEAIRHGVWLARSQYYCYTLENNSFLLIAFEVWACLHDHPQIGHIVGGVVA